MAVSIAQTLFEDHLDSLSPEKTGSVFTDNDDCTSPMMEFFCKSKKFGVIPEKCGQAADAVQRRRKRTLRRINTLSKTTLVCSPSGVIGDLDNCSSLDNSTVTVKKAHNFGTSLLENEGSQDSGVRVEDDDTADSSPLIMPSRQLKLFDEDACSPLSYSPVKPQTHDTGFSSFSLRNCDDGFFEDFAAVETTEPADLPGTFATLFKAPLISTKTPNDDFQVKIMKMDQLEKIKKPACLKLSGRFNSMGIRPKGGQKRQNQDDNEDNPLQKRRRGVGMIQRSCSAELPPREQIRVPLKRYRSETDAITRALDRAENDPDLIGDGSVSFCLPTIPGKHQDLKSITPETLAKVINHEYDHVIEKFIIVDCRYPYEFDGGHIQGGKNYYTKETILANLLEDPVQPTDSDKRVMLIFHCEFSSERAPKMSRFLRNMDRDQNKHCYPYLHYPEVYLLHGGYKNFFETQKDLCEPQTYVPMLHEDHKQDYTYFRMKTKTYDADKKSRSVRGRLGFQ